MVYCLRWLLSDSSNSRLTCVKLSVLRGFAAALAAIIIIIIVIIIKESPGQRGGTHGFNSYLHPSQGATLSKLLRLFGPVLSSVTRGR